MVETQLVFRSACFQKKLFSFASNESSSTNNYNTDIAQYLKKKKQPGDETWSANGTLHEKYFSYKIIHKIWQKKLVPDFFLKI